MRSRNLLAPVVLGLLAAGGLAFLAMSRDWGGTTVRTAGLPPDDVTVTGTTALPLASALALVVLTSGLAVLAAGPRLRRAIGVLVVVVSIGALVVLATGQGALDAAVRDAVEQSPAFAGRRATQGASLGGWAVAAGACFVVALALGVVTTRFGGTWSTMSRRYENPATRPDDPDDLWKALDEGRDPTA
ncbi:MAG: Trp biosynthesis-associated membrane protein [Aeromicrobium erythreum]